MNCLIWMIILRKRKLINVDNFLHTYIPDILLICGPDNEDAYKNLHFVASFI